MTIASGSRCSLSWPLTTIRPAISCHSSPLSAICMHAGRYGELACSTYPGRRTPWQHDILPSMLTRSENKKIQSKDCSFYPIDAKLHINDFKLAWIHLDISLHNISIRVNSIFYLLVHLCDCIYPFKRIFFGLPYLVRLRGVFFSLLDTCAR